MPAETKGNKAQDSKVASVANIFVYAVNLRLQAGVASSDETEVASFTDTNPGDGDFTARIDWGDGKVADGKVLQELKPADTDDQTEKYVVQGGHTYPSAGRYHITITITDPTGASVKVSSSALVNPPPPNSGSYRPEPSPGADSAQVTGLGRFNNDIAVNRRTIDRSSGAGITSARLAASRGTGLDNEVAAIRRMLDAPVSRAGAQPPRLATVAPLDNEVAAIRRMLNEPISIAVTQPRGLTSPRTLDNEIAAIRRLLNKPGSIAVAEPAGLTSPRTLEDEVTAVGREPEPGEPASETRLAGPGDPTRPGGGSVFRAVSAPRQIQRATGQ